MPEHAAAVPPRIGRFWILVTALLPGLLSGMVMVQPVATSAPRDDPAIAQFQAVALPPTTDDQGWPPPLLIIDGERIDTNPRVIPVSTSRPSDVVVLSTPAPSDPDRGPPTIAR